MALLAGVSVEYDTRLERGTANGVSDSVLEALVRVLRLDDAERAHLYDLARGATTADLFDGAGPGSVGRTPDHARYAFLDARAPDFYPDRHRVAADIVAQLRAEAGRSPDDRELTELIGELAIRSQQFGTLWATHDVRWHTTGTKRFHPRVVGDLGPAYEGLALPADPGQTLITFTAEPGSPSQQALAFLASWATSPAQRPAALEGTTDDRTT